MPRLNSGNQTSSANQTHGSFNFGSTHAISIPVKSNFWAVGGCRPSQTPAQTFKNEFFRSILRELFLKLYNLSNSDLSLIRFKNPKIPGISDPKTFLSHGRIEFACEKYCIHNLATRSILDNLIWNFRILAELKLTSLSDDVLTIFKC